MADGWPWERQKMPWVALADLRDTERFDKDGEENQLYAFKLSKEQKVTQEESLKFEELSDVDTLHAVPKR